MLSNQKYQIQPTFINLHINEYNQEYHYCPFEVKLDRCIGSFSTLYDFSNKVCALKEPEDLKLSMSNMIAEINESKKLAKHTSWESKRRFDETKCNSDQWWNNDKCQCECKNVMSKRSCLKAWYM